MSLAGFYYSHNKDRLVKHTAIWKRDFFEGGSDGF